MPTYFKVFVLTLPNPCVQVADFNLSKILGEDRTNSQEVTNPRWLSPEVLQVRPRLWCCNVVS
jgi:hypothetical protein